MPKPKPIKRAQGRPADGGVGRAVILECTKALLREVPPARITISMVASRAGVDRALVRYYFKDRANLLQEVVSDLLGEIPRATDPQHDPVQFLRDRVRDTHRFSSAAKHMQRLMIDELTDSKSDAIKERQRALNEAALAAYRSVSGGGPLRAFEPLYLYLVIVGIFDFFVSADPLIRSLVPPETNFDALGQDFEEFVADLLLNGLIAKAEGQA